MGRKESDIKSLCDNIESTHVITCCQCKQSHEASGIDATDFAIDMYNNGWRIIDQAPACQNCK